MEYIFDTHAHYDDEAFDEDRDAVLTGLYKLGIGTVVNVGASLSSCRTTFALAQKYPFVYGAVGVHPSETGELEEHESGEYGPTGRGPEDFTPENAVRKNGGSRDDSPENCGQAEVRSGEQDPKNRGADPTVSDMEWLRGLTENEKIVAIGEIGLDYYWDEPEREIQKKWFVRQLALAKETGLPVIIHSRDAAKDTLDIMKAEHHGETGGVIHCFSYGVEMAREYLNMGYFLGIGGVLTFKNAKKLKEVVEYAPVDALVLETDCPYLAPVPYRGKRNYSGHLPLVAEEIARIKGITPDEVRRLTAENARRLYRLEEVNPDIHPAVLNGAAK